MDETCANCGGMFGDLAPGRDPEELCDSCYDAATAALASQPTQEAPSSDVVEALDMAVELIQEAKGAEGPNGGFVTNHLDAAESHLDRVRIALASTAGDTLKAELEQAYGALRWVYVHGVQSSHIRPAKITEIFNDAFASHRIAQDWSPKPRTALGSDQ